MRAKSLYRCLSQRADLTSTTCAATSEHWYIHKRHDYCQGCSVLSHHLDSSHQAVTWPYWGSIEPPLPAMIVSASVCSSFFPASSCVPMPKRPQINTWTSLSHIFIPLLSPPALGSICFVWFLHVLLEAILVSKFRDLGIGLCMCLS